MAEVRIRLPKGEWFFDDARHLGPAGGFGQVFEGRDPVGNPVAVKRLHVTAAAAAHRELTIADDLSNRRMTHVLPIYDAGQDPDSGAYFIVMPRADRSLDDELRTRRGNVPEPEAVDVLRQIAAGLIEVEDIVHRDLKPGNVLMHEGRWKVADFGIARFVGDATSVNTLKECLTPQFAAPEQWKSEQATGATDVYALGCIAHVLVAGNPPFPGPTGPDYQRQHLSQVAPSLVGVDSRLRAVVAASLRKPPAGRPVMSRVAAILADIAAHPTPAPGLAELQRVNAIEAERVSETAAQAADASRRDDERKALVHMGEQILREIATEMGGVVAHNAPEATVSAGPQIMKIKMGDSGATLELVLQGAVPPNVDFSRIGWQPVAIGFINVIQRVRGEWLHGATLWFMRIRDGEYRWYEVSYQKHGLAAGAAVGPFPIQQVGDDIYGHAEAAAGPGMHVLVVQSGPTPIDDENAPAFIERWLGRLAAAYEGRLRPF